MKWRTVAVVIVAVGALAAVHPRAQQQPYSGQGDYQVYCSSCHGPDGRGDGAIAKSLKMRPSNLTQLAKRNDGVFPEARVVKVIDGRHAELHANTDMPAWGEVFAKASESPGAEQAAARIDVLVKYLETLQVK